MGSIREASRQHGGWQILAKIVDKHIFTTWKKGELLHLLVLLAVDSNGDTIELKTWRTRKAYTVYRKVHANQIVDIKGTAIFREPNRVYSASNYMALDRWFVQPSESKFVHRKYFPCVSNVDEYRNSNRKRRPTSVLGAYVSHSEGPKKMTRANHLIAQGYHVELADDSGEHFRLLVWHLPSIEKRFSILHSKSGDTVLVPYAREAHHQDGLTSLYAPVVNSECIDPHKRRSLNPIRHYALIATVQPDAYAVPVGS